MTSSALIAVYQNFEKHNAELGALPELVKTCLFDICCGLNFDLREELVVSGGAGFKEGIPPTDVSNGDERLVGGELRLNKRSATPPSASQVGSLLGVKYVLMSKLNSKSSIGFFNQGSL